MLTGVTTEQKGEQRWSGLRFARDGKGKKGTGLRAKSRNCDTAAAAKTETNSERTLFRCPVCGHIYRIAYSDGLVAGEIPAFCQDCGQRLLQKKK